MRGRPLCTIINQNSYGVLVINFNTVLLSKICHFALVSLFKKLSRTQNIKILQCIFSNCWWVIIVLLIQVYFDTVLLFIYRVGQGPICNWSSMELLILGFFALLASLVDSARFYFHRPGIWSKIQHILLYVWLAGWYKNFVSVLLTYDVHLSVNFGVKIEVAHETQFLLIRFPNGILSLPVAESYLKRRNIFWFWF